MISFKALIDPKKKRLKKVCENYSNDAEICEEPREKRKTIARSKISVKIHSV